MQKILIVITLIFCAFTINAQNNITINLSRTIINSEDYVTITITNNNDQYIIIPTGHVSFDNGNAIGGGPSYITLTPYNSYMTAYPSTKKRYIFNENHGPIIRIDKNKSYTQREKLYTSNGIEGFFEIPFNPKFYVLVAKVHLIYIYPTGSNQAINCENDFTSGNIIFY